MVMLSAYKAVLGFTSVALMSLVTYDPAGVLYDVEIKSEEPVEFEDELDNFTKSDDFLDSIMSEMEAFDIPLMDETSLADVLTVVGNVCTNFYFLFTLGFMLELWYIVTIARKMLQDWREDYEKQYKQMTEAGRHTMANVREMEEHFLHLANTREQQFSEIQTNIERIQQEHDTFVERNDQKIKEMIELMAKRFKARGEPLANFHNGNVRHIGTRTGIPVFMNSPRPLQDSPQFRHLFQNEELNSIETQELPAN